MIDGAFYFGCWNEPGHFLRSANGRTHHVDATLPDDFPLMWRILDGGLLPPCRPQVEGIATFIHINGWTVLSFWDRSVDKRPGCNSAFLLRGIYTFDVACKAAAEMFPTVWGRFQFEIMERRS